MIVASDTLVKVVAITGRRRKYGNDGIKVGSWITSTGTK